jgi:hypothetical protein
MMIARNHTITGTTMILYDVSNGILVTGKSIEELKQKRNECRKRGKPTVQFERLQEQRARRQKGQRLQGTIDPRDRRGAKGINWGKIRR